MGFDTSYHVLDPAAMATVVRYLTVPEAERELDPWVRHAVEIRRVRYRANEWAMKAKQVGDLDPFRHVWGRPFLVADGTPQQVAERVVEWYASSMATVDELARKNLRIQWADRPDVDDLVARSDPGPGAVLEGSDEDLRDEVSWQLQRLRAACMAVREGRGDEPAMGADGEYSHRRLLTTADFNAMIDLVVHTPGWMSRGHTFLTRDLFPGDFFPIGRELEKVLGDLDLAHDGGISNNYEVGGTFAPGELGDLPHEVTDDLVRSFAEQLGGDEEYARSELTKAVESILTAELLGYGWCEAADIYEPMAGRMN